jgi:hypothetical protein
MEGEELTSVTVSESHFKIHIDYTPFCSKYAMSCFIIKQCFLKCPTFPETAVIRHSGIPNSTKNGKLCISVGLYHNAFGLTAIGWLPRKLVS